MKTEEKQQLALKILREVNIILKNNNIYFICACGTALGAIRHKGFIPWDSDIDICIPITQIKIARDILKHELPDNMRICVWDEEQEYHTVCDRVILKEYSHDFIHVDIFPMVGTPNNPLLRKIFIYECYFIYRIFHCKYVSTEFVRAKNKKKILFIKTFVSLIPDKVIRAIYHHLENCWSFEKSHNICYIIGDGERECIKKSLIMEALEKDFEDLKVPIPKYYDEYLTCLYGDYMTPVVYDSND